MNVHALRAGAVALVAALAAACSGQQPAAGTVGPGGLDRTVLPIHEPAAPDQIAAALIDKLLEKGYSESDCKKFLGGNFYRVFKQVWR